jgi:hypothetical protein
MAEFGWAYVTGLLAGGVSGSVQVNDGDLRLSGSRKLIYNETSGSLNLTGSLNVSGAITANQYNVNVINRNVINLSASGDTKFGDTLDDTHQYTGSVYITGSGNPLVLKGLQPGTANSSNHFLAIDSNYNVVLTSSDGGPGGNGLIRTYTNPADNRIITSIDAEGINAEANLLFNGNTLTVTGDLTASVGVSSSVGQYTHLTGSRFTDGTLLINNGSLTNATTVNATNLGGTLTTAAQANVTSVGTLTALNVSGDVSASALFVSASNNRVGIGVNNPEKKMEIYDKNEQLRLTYSKAIPFLETNKHTDLLTNSDGYLILSPSGQRVGIGTSSPSRMLDVDGNMRISGNLEVSGSLHAKVSEFIVTANNITFGDSATDTLTYNAASASIPNSLRFATNLLSLDNANSKVGIGVSYPDNKLEILDSSAQLKLSYDESNSSTLHVDAAGDLNITPTGLAITASADLYVTGNTVLGGDASKTVTVTGALTSSVGFSGSIGQFTQLTASYGQFDSVTVGGSTVTITPTTVSGATTTTSDNYVGTLTTAAQPNITSVGNLTSLTVDTNVLVVDSATDRVGIGITDPRKPLEILHSSAKQLRLSQQQAGGIGVLDIYTDFQTNDDGYLLIDPSGARVGIGTSTPKRMLDVDGHMRISGNLEITGALHAKVSEFIVTADNITFGQDAQDTLIFNAATGTIMNGLNWDGNTWVMDSDNNRIGVGVAHPQAKTHILSNSQNQLRLGYSLSSYVELGVDVRGDLNLKPSGDYITASAGFYASGSAILGNSCVDVVTCNGQLTASCGVSGTIGLLTHLTSNTMTDGVATITGGDISGVGTLTATSVAGTLTTPAQGNVTSLGTLSSLAVTGDLTVDTTTFKVNSSTNRVGIGVTDPTKPLEISSSAGGLRLTYSRFVFGQSNLVYSDLSTDSSGKLVLESSGNKTKVVGGLEITGLASGVGVTTKYLALDSSNNIILTQSATPGIETRNRRVISGNSTLSEDDYYIGINAATNVTLTLLGAEDLANGQTFTVKDEGGSANSHIFKIQASGSQLIDGESFVQIESPYGAINLYTNGTDKYFIF